MTGNEVLWTAAAVLLVYFVTLRRINTFIQPLRLRMVDLGNELLADKRLPEHYSFGVGFELDMAYSPWNLFLSILVLPIVAGQMVLNSSARNAACKEYEAMPQDLRRKIDLFLNMANKSMYVANPLLYPVYLMELLVLWIVALFLGRTERAVSVIMTHTWENEDRMVSKFSGHRHNHA